MKEPEIKRISNNATRSCHQDVLVIDAKLIKAKAAHAAESKRKREIHILHTGDEDTLQRMLNSVQPGSYIAPHRHTATPKAESFIVLQGSIAFVIFDDGPKHDEQAWLIDPKKGISGIDCREGLWHCFFALEPDTVIFEVKPGPFDCATDKEFATFAPHENDDQAVRFLATMEDRFRITHNLPSRSWSF